ncbi:MAG: hypothetical protein RL333_97 [Pseudomonadota bacterium]
MKGFGSKDLQGKIAQPIAFNVTGWNRDHFVSSLDEIESRIERLIENIRGSHPDWLCRRGCDSCCRRLAELPIITRAEWLRLKAGLLTLSAELRQRILTDIGSLAGATMPVMCPMLDADEGACRIYPYRPLACRSYGYYMQKGIGLHCQQIEQKVASGLLDQVVWGNQDALDRDLRVEGEPRSLAVWIDDPLDGMHGGYAIADKSI